MYGRGSHDRLTDSGDWRERIVLTDHRYMMEGSAAGLSFLVSAANCRRRDAGWSPRHRRRVSATRILRAAGGRLASPGLGDLRPRWLAETTSRRISLDAATFPLVACLGAGRMGRGIAVAFAYAGHHVRLVDVKRRTAEQFSKTLEAKPWRSQRDAGEACRVFKLLSADDAAAIVARSVAPAQEMAPRSPPLHRVRRRARGGRTEARSAGHRL